MALDNDMKTPKERALEALYKALPELKRLERGCLIKFPNGDPLILNLLKSRSDGKHDLYCSSTKDGMNVEMTGLTTQHVEDFIIIGHPPKLNDWILLLSKYAETLDVDVGADYIAFIIGEGINDFAYCIKFRLTDGQPATEQDWEVMTKVLKV